MGIQNRLTPQIESLGPPRQIVNPAESKHLQYIDIGGDIEDVGRQRNQYLHIFAAVERPDDGDSMPKYHKKNKRTQVNNGYDELLSALSIEIEEYLVGVVDQQENDEDAVYSEQSGGSVVYAFEAVVVVVDEGGVQHNGEHQHDVDVVDDVGDGLHYILEVEDADFVVSQVVDLVFIEEVEDQWHYVLAHCCD